MCREALPEHIDEDHEWEGTDHDNWLFRWFIPFKLKYLAFGPRDSHKWHKWREWPILIFAFGSKDPWRFENDITDRYSWSKKPGFYEYLSRIQYKKAWHIQLQWPLFFAAHVMLGSKPLYFYIGCHRDADKVYWLGSLFLGLTWK